MDNIHKFIQDRPYLVWYIKDLNQIDEASIVEHVLNYGDWNDVQGMISILGIQKTAEIFNKRSTPDRFNRQNYLPEIKNYFQLYFNKYARSTQ